MSRRLAADRTPRDRQTAGKGARGRQDDDPLKSHLPPRPLLSGLLRDTRPEWDALFKRKVFAVAKREGLDPPLSDDFWARLASGDFWARLAVRMLFRHEPAFQPEPRGRHAANRSEVHAAQLELIELYIAENVARIAKGSKPLSDKAFVDKLVSRAGSRKLPSYYKAKLNVGERMLRRELASARESLALFSDAQSAIMSQHNLDKVRLHKAANFAALSRRKRASRKVGTK
jgi:hypothetical protein